MALSLPARYREEQAFMREILFEPTDLSARLIYADWLDERQDPRARLLRIDVELQQLSSDDFQRQLLVLERAEIVPKLDRDWVSWLGLASIERCPGSTVTLNWTATDAGSRPERIEFKYRCPKRWENLPPFDDDPHTRFCNECERTVHYCYNIETARWHARRDRCVALDPSVTRQPNDLDSDSEPGEFMGEMVAL